MTEKISGMEMKSGDLVTKNPTHTNVSEKEICEMVQYVATAMEKNTHFQILSGLPMEVRKRIRALRKLQLLTNAIEMEFHEKKFELEKEFYVKHQEIFKKRLDIITGEYEPNEEECDIPDPDILEQIDENVEIFAELQKRNNEQNIDNDGADTANDLENKDELENAVKGVPGFWFHILYSNPTFDFLIHKTDESILKHLIDIRTTYQSKPHFSFTLEFEFSPNPYFENSILTKEYLLKMKSDESMYYEGPAIYRTIGCEIAWKIDKPQSPSIFEFFNPPILPEDTMDPKYEEIKNMLENHFELGDYVKDNIVPNAILYFTGERDDESDFEKDGSDSKSESDDFQSDESVSNVEDRFEADNGK